VSASLARIEEFQEPMSPTSNAKKPDADAPRPEREIPNPRNLPEPEPPPSPPLPQQLPSADRPGAPDDEVVDPTPFIDPDVEIPEDQREPIVG
jgi:hypothetical protein